MGRYSYSTLPFSASSISTQTVWRVISINCTVLLIIFWSCTFIPRQSQLSLNFQDQHKIDASTKKDTLLVVAPAGIFNGSYGSYGLYGQLTNQTRVWKGIRFGKKPVRFEPPEPADDLPLGEIYQNYDSPACVQVPSPDVRMSEDCLFLSITAPRAPRNGSSDGYPVMIFIHPGTFETGEGANSVTADTYTFSRNGIIGVEINYRLSIFGAYATNISNGNLQLQDQRLAMRWVQRNIAAFGGDPNKVTLMGVSAGALSIYAHLASPYSNGLYCAAAFSSGPIGILFPTLAQSINITSMVFKHAGCLVNDLECMRRRTYMEVLNAQGELPQVMGPIPFMPHVDPKGDLPIQPFVAVKNGYYPDVPLFVSFDRDDAIVYVETRIHTSVTPAEYPLYLAGFAAMFMNVTNITWASNELEEMYPFTNDISDGRLLISKVATDGLTVCPTLVGLEGAAAKKKPPIYLYEFVHVYSGQLKYAQVWERTAVPHGYDYACAIGPPVDILKFDAAERRMCHSLNSAFSNFIEYGDPNYGRPLVPSMYFPRLNDDRHFLLLDTESTVGTYSRYDVCKNFWNAVQPIP